MKNSKTLLLTLAALIGLVAAACGGNQEKPRILPLLDEARNLNSDVRSDWQRTQDTMTTTLTTVEGLPVLGVDAERFDIALLRQALTECFQSPLGVGGDAGAGADAVDGAQPVGVIETDVDARRVCAGEALNALLDLAKRYDKDVAQFIDNKVLAVASLKVNLKQTLPSQSRSIAEQYAAARQAVARLNTTAEDLKRQADTNSSMTDDEKRQFRSDYDALKKELEGLDALLDSIEEDSLNLTNQIRAGIEKVNQSLVSMGQ